MNCWSWIQAKFDNFWGFWQIKSKHVDEKNCNTNHPNLRSRPAECSVHIWKICFASLIMTFQSQKWWFWGIFRWFLARGGRSMGRAAEMTWFLPLSPSRRTLMWKKNFFPQQHHGKCPKPTRRWGSIYSVYTAAWDGWGFLVSWFRFANGTPFQRPPLHPGSNSQLLCPFPFLFFYESFFHWMHFY